MRVCADVGSFIESETSEVQTSHVGFTSEVSDYLVVHTGPGEGDREARGVHQTVRWLAVSDEEINCGCGENGPLKVDRTVSWK